MIVALARKLLIDFREYRARIRGAGCPPTHIHTGHDQVETVGMPMNQFNVRILVNSDFPSKGRARPLLTIRFAPCVKITDDQLVKPRFDRDCASSP
jgi:hypothetical protein